ncbi:hypothetical protein DPMN_101511 [Dreissena polymorpha]|uniref:Uncharacterized protein n=1 Tax=Dreissena polymorpha TaxID=45954 RepID=A0A9D4R8D6_DREPO|nr:hypothetical protein DPMN_101511 [Dreissena polymorpha]
MMSHLLSTDYACIKKYKKLMMPLANVFRSAVTNRKRSALRSSAIVTPRNALHSRGPTLNAEKPRYLSKMWVALCYQCKDRIKIVSVSSDKCGGLQ